MFLNFSIPSILRFFDFLWFADFQDFYEFMFEPEHNGDLFLFDWSKWAQRMFRFLFYVSWSDLRSSEKVSISVKKKMVNFSNQHNFMLKWNFSIMFDVIWSWGRVLFISEVFCVFTTNHMLFPSVNPIKCSQKANQNHDQNTKKDDQTLTKTLDCYDSYCVEYFGLRSTISCGWWWTQKHVRNDEYVTSAS